MDATQMISDSILESDEEGYEEKNDNNRGDPLAKLCILKNEHIPETELPLFLGDNVLGRDPNTCTLPLSAPSISKQHATIYISVYRKRDSHREMDIEALVWDLGSMNGTRKGRLKLTPEVRYALSDGDSLVVADIPCQYVSCAVNTVSSQGNMRTPVSRKSSVKARLPDTSEQKGSDTGSKKCVNGGTKARLSQTKTPLKTSCLSFEQTPTQPQGTLVPESDSESEDERQGGGPRMRKTLVSDSDSHKSSPTCSTFLSPINKIVPESEDESPITPSSSTKNRPYRDVSLSKEETEVDMGRQELMQKQALAILDNSEEEQGTEEERLKSDGIESVENGQHVPTKYAPVIPTFNMDSDTDVDGDEEGVASAGPVTLNTNQVKEPPHTGQFHVDSDTDVEEDEEGVASAGPVTLNTNQVKEPPHTGQFHMDSDTDVEEDEEGVASAGPVTLNTNQVKEPPNTGRFHMDSDTDVDEDAPKTVDTYVENDAAGSDAAKSAYTADSVHLVQPNDFCLDSDTDADDEEEMECVKTKSSSKMDASHAGLDVKSIGPDSTPAASHSLHRDSLAAPAIALSSCSEEEDFVVAETQSFVLQTRDCPGNPAGDHIMDHNAFGLEPSDDEKDEQSSNGRSFQLGLSDSSHLQCQAQALAFESTQAFDLVDRNVKLEDTQAYADSATGENNETDIKNSSAEAQPLYFPTSSTLAMAETQPVSVFKEEESLATDKPSSSSQQVKSRNQNEKEEGGKDEEVAQLQERLSSEALSIAETQPLQTCQDEESNNEHSVPQMITNAELSALSVMETQPVHIGVPEILLSGKEESGKKESDFEPDEEKTPTIINSDLSIVETQPMNNVEESEEEVTIAVSRKRRAKPLLLEETQPLSNSERMSSLETQPMGAYEDEESSDEDLFPGPRKTKAKPLKSEDEQTQPLTNSVVETQPTVMCEDKEISNEELIPGSHKRKANALQMKEEETRSFTNPEVSNVEASVQPEKVTEGQSEPGPSGDTVRVKRGTQKKIKEEDKQAKCSGPLKIQIRGKGKALSNSRGRRGKSRLDEDESEVAKEVEQSKRTTGKKYVNQQKDKEQEERNEHFESKSLIREKHEGRVAEENNVAALRQEESEKMEKEQREAMEEQERLRAENAEKIRLEEEKAEKERKEQEEKSRYEQIKKEKEEQLERERRENEEKEKRGHEKAEREEKEKMMRKEQEEKERLDTEKRELEKRLEREREEQEHKEKLEREERERLEKETDAKEKQVEEKQENKEEGNMLKVPTRAQRAARRTVATQPEQFSTISTSDDVPARRTRSRSNSSNSVSSERSASSINTQESRGRGRGRGRGVKRTSEPQTASARSRRRTVAAETSQQDCNDNSPQERRSRSNSSSSLNTDISSCSAVSQTRGRGGRQRGRGKKTEPDSISPVNSKSDQNSASKPSARGRKSRKAEELSNEDCQQATTTRERQRASAHGSKSAAPDEEEQSNQEGCYASEESPLIKRNVRGRGQIVLFTGVVDEAGERVLTRLGGSIAKGVADMNCLVTDKVRRTVKFLCALAKGIPIVTTHWLEKSGKAGYFLPPNAFVVKDPEQEKKFSFSLEESLRTASSQPLLQGYEIHFTKSVKPEPVHMKDIISCSGATFLPRMPSSHKPQTVVISCEEDWLLCGPAVSAFVPVVTAEFILTGILQQKLDFQTHTLSAPATNPQPAGGRGRGRKKT
uniref:Mediator of DNA damage checkpoint protein 1 n=1 Tax=Anabas testudineus TaxID=64144 RepID=A0A7N6AFT5_ANATE